MTTAAHPRKTTIWRGVYHLICVLLGVILLPVAGAAQTTGTLAPVPIQQYFDNNGIVCTGCSLYTYSAGTSTPLATYADPALLTPNTDPIVLNSAGRNPAGGIYLTVASYKFILKSASGSTIWTQDNVSAVALVANSTAINNIIDGRLTLVSSTPVPSTDVTAATTVYYTPYGGSRITLYDGASWAIYTFTEQSIALGSDAANKNYDVFAYVSAGVVHIERLVWTTDSTRATALATQDGVYVKAGDATRRYLGTYRTTGSAGQTEDSVLNRLCWNYYHRVTRPVRALDSTATWTYTTATYRQARATATNQVGVVIGVAEVTVDLRLMAFASNGTAGVVFATAIGEDSTTTPAAESLGEAAAAQVTNTIVSVNAQLLKQPAAGYHTYVWLERSEATGTSTWSGNNGVGTLKAGLHGQCAG